MSHVGHTLAASSWSRARAALPPLSPALAWGLPLALVVCVRAAAEPVVIDYCGYIGSSSMAYAVAVGADGSASVTGYVASPSLPVVVGPDATYNGGPLDAYVAKVDPSGAGLVYCGYLGG